MATREEYLKICRDWDPETQEMWFGKSCKMHAGHGDPAEIGPSIWSQNGYEIRPKRRELGQWIFEGASASTISAHKDMDGVWKFSSYDRTLSVIHVHGLSHQPTGLDHIRPEDSLIIRDPPHLVKRIEELEHEVSEDYHVLLEMFKDLLCKVLENDTTDRDSFEGASNGYDLFHFSEDAIRRIDDLKSCLENRDEFIRQAVAEERERCARICNENGVEYTAKQIREQKA